MKTSSIYKLLCLHACKSVTAITSSVFRFTPWLVHLVGCITLDLVLVVLISDTDPSFWLGSKTHDMTFSALLSSDHASVGWQLVANGLKRSLSGLAVRPDYLCSCVLIAICLARSSTAQPPITNGTAPLESCPLPTKLQFPHSWDKLYPSHRTIGSLYAVLRCRQCLEEVCRWSVDDLARRYKNLI